MPTVVARRFLQFGGTAADEDQQIGIDVADVLVDQGPQTGDRLIQGIVPGADLQLVENELGQGVGAIGGEGQYGFTSSTRPFFRVFLMVA
ncbi:MAG: hypothetical protein HQL83_07000 [Magnetococcales bacterium]|nr:hypothetical protein [Magnetococcales bacterium]